MPVTIFLSYRRRANDYASLLYRDLAQRFGFHQVFKDVESIIGGADYVNALQRALTNCDVFVGMIDPYWAADEAGWNRLVDPEDWVRTEFETALSRGMPIIPAILEGAPRPDATILPPSMLPVARIQAVPLRDRMWQQDMARLSSLVERVAISKVGGNPAALVEGGNPLTRRRQRTAALMTPGMRVRIGMWAGTFKREETGLPFEIAANKGHSGTLLRLDGRLAWVRWDRQTWSKRRLGVLGGSKVQLDSFESGINADWLESFR
jgi:hypothetical protein